MSETLASITLDLAKILPGYVVEGTATGGSATTLIDTNFPWHVTKSSASTRPADNYYIDGTLWFTAAGSTASLNNVGDTRIVTAWTSTSATFTFATADTKVASGDAYSVAPDDFRRDVLRRSINMALADIGGELLYNSATTTVADQMIYDLPSGVYNIKTVQIANSTSSPYSYFEHHQWDEINDDLYFHEGYQPTSTGYIIRLGYEVPLTALTSDSQTLPDQYDKDMVIWTAAAHALRWKIGTLRGDEETWLKDRLAEAMANSLRYQNMRMKRITRKPRSHQYSAWAGGSDIELDSTPGHVRFRS